MFSPGYKGSGFYIDEPSVADNNLITAGSTGGLLWAKQIIERLDVFLPNTLEACHCIPDNSRRTSPAIKRPATGGTKDTLPGVERFEAASSLSARGFLGFSLE